MNDPPAGRRHRPHRYEIRLEGLLAARWTAWFDGMTLTPCVDGTTVLAGPVADQAALHGVLGKLRDLGLPLVSVTRVDTPEPAGPATSPPGE
jgi:hypothetical protein